jgi:serine/threonine protein kinase
MSWLSDEAVSRLREVTEVPDLGGTRYTIIRELGRGGMGVVYEAGDVELDRRVALKVTNIAAGSVDDLRAEARIIAHLEHPGIVPVHDVGVLDDGRVFYSMKLVRGTRLDDWAAAPHALNERLRLFARICEPVAFAHAAGIVHRDLKPENVMVGELGEMLVMDWGVTGVGTPGFMAPEQERGEEVTPQADVHALGRLLAFLVGGETPARRLRAIIAKASSQDPALRYSDARGLALDVVSLLDHEPVTAYRENVLDRAERLLSRHRVLISLIAAYVVMRVIVFFWIRL